MKFSRISSCIHSLLFLSIMRKAALFAARIHREGTEAQRAEGISLASPLWKQAAGMPKLTLPPVPATWISGFLKLTFSALDRLGWHSRKPKMAMDS